MKPQEFGQFKPDSPILLDGNEVKYITDKGHPYDAIALPHPDPEYWQRILDDPLIPVDLDEGAKKSGAGMTCGFPSLALCGVTLWQFKGELVSNLAALAVPGRTFRIRFDMDLLFKEGVLCEVKKLAKALRKKGCNVLVAMWDKGLGLKIDDVLVKHGPEMVKKIMADAVPYPQWLKNLETQLSDVGEPHDTGNERKTKKPPTPRETAAEVGGEYQPIWKYDNEQKTWRIWNDKCWQKTEIGVFTSLLQTVLDAKNIPYPGSAYINDVRELLENRLRQPQWQTWDKKRYISFNDCVLDGDTGKALPHSPGMGFTSYLPYDYKPLGGDLSNSLEALRVNCPNIHKFFRTAMQGETKKMFKLLAIVNAILKHRFFDLQMFVHLVGAPGSGKGTFARLMEKLVGRDNFKGCQLDRLSDGSTRASIVDKQLAVFADERKPNGIDSILSFTGGDAVSYRELHTKAADAFFYGCILICSNKPIFVGDTTGLERRLCLVHFDNPIPTEKRDHSIESEFDAEIPALIGVALSLANNAVKLAVQGVGAERIAEFKTKEWEMKVEVNSVAAFFDAELILDPTATVRVGKLYDAYKYFCEEGGLSKFSIVKFPRLLSDILTEEKLPVTRHQGAQAYFEGLRIRDNSDTHPTHSETLAGVEGVTQGVSGSCEGVGEGVAPPQNKGLRDLRELDSQKITRSKSDDDYLPDNDESDLEKDFSPPTPSTPSKVEPVKDVTPYTTPIKPPNSSPQLPQTFDNEFLASAPADEMRNVLTSSSTAAEKRTAAREIWKQFENVPLSQRGQQRGFFWQNLKQTNEENKARLLIFAGLSEGEKLKYVGSTEQYKGLELAAYSADGTNRVTVTCLKPDGTLTTWIPLKDLRKL
jgi:putative DNA primase/helicase